MTRPTLVIASTNRGKCREFSDLLAGEPFQLRSLNDLASQAPVIEEDQPSFLGNATKKALAIADWSGLPALADDSGLEVDALAGAPGVQSARYAGADQNSAANIAKLLAALRAVPSERRTARFRCVIVVARPDGRMLSAEGTCEGRILEAPRGTGGFGYDPLFLYPPLSQSFAEIPSGAKNRISHRALACELIRPQLAAFLETR